MAVSFSGMFFHFGLEEVRIAYRATREALSAQEGSAEARLRKQYGLTPDEPIVSGEANEQGETFADYFWERVGEMSAELDMTTSVIRGAFLIALFHLWERHSNEWIQQTSYNHMGTITFLQAEGLTPDDNALQLLQKLANCLKHGPGHSCNDLAALDPSLLKSGALPPYGSDDVVVTDQLVEQMFAAVMKSGPKLNTPWATTP